MKLVQYRSTAESLSTVAVRRSVQERSSIPSDELEASRCLLSTVREESPLLHAFLDDRHKVVELPTFYLRAVRLEGRPETSRKTIAAALKAHCQWLERWPRFNEVSVDEAIKLVDIPDVVDWIVTMREEGTGGRVRRDRKRTTGST